MFVGGDVDLIEFDGLVLGGGRGRLRGEGGDEEEGKGEKETGRHGGRKLKASGDYGGREAGVAGEPWGVTREAGRLGF